MLVTSFADNGLHAYRNAHKETQHFAEGSQFSNVKSVECKTTGMLSCLFDFVAKSRGPRVFQ